MKDINWPTSSDMLVSFDTNEDAGVYRISQEKAIVQTIDFITPVVNDPYIYGQIAAANSLSDIFAMGAKALTVLNLVAYDNCNITKEMLNQILRGGLSKVAEADAVILGGHTIEDVEMKFGMAVTGIIHPDKIIRNNTAEPDDSLILTKPLGMGVITTSIKADLAPQSAIDKAIFHMSYLNKTASEIAVENQVHAMTDVTGFGLLGHCSEMLKENIEIELEYDSIPIIEEAFELAEMGLFPAGSINNRKYYSQNVEVQKEGLDLDQQTLLYDAQTSGGLLIAVSKAKADRLIEQLHHAGLDWSRIIGKVKSSEKSRIVIK